MWWWLAACGSPPCRCGADECAEVCAAARPAEVAAPTPGAPPEAPARGSDFEEALLAPAREDVRAGVRPWDDTAIGVCVGKRECKEFLGADAGELSKGDHLVKAELRVPTVGEKGSWKVHFETECRVERPGAEPTVATYARDYDVWYVGPDKGFRLLPLRAIESPSKEGPQACTWTLTARHPDGDRSWTGSWRVPGR
jgi:hypothetical protein